MIGRPGCGLLQMNGEPTAQNTRETGADGDLPAFRNWDNPEHIKELASIWNVEASTIPHWAPPTHALQIFRYCEIGSIRLLWIQATNPAVSMPNLPRIRTLLSNPDLFVGVQDAFMTETAEFADVVLPAALWGEKTGCFTNVDRTVHISHKAVEPPGEAKSDLDIFVDFARRMDFRDKDGAPLIKWSTPVQAFEAWKACTRGRPCDYTGLTYAKLSQGNGVSWPCNAAHPDGEHWPYKDLVFPTDADFCETFGHDLITGAIVSPEKYRANKPTLYEWDAVSKQPHFNYAAVKLKKISKASLAQPERVELHPEQRGLFTVGDLAERTGELAASVIAAIEQKIKPERSHIADYVGLLDESEKRLVKAFQQVRATHPDEPDIGPLCKLFGEWSAEAESMLKPFVARYGERKQGEPKRLDKALLVKRKQGGFDMLRDLHDLWLLVNESMISLNVLEQAARALRDEALLETLKKMQDRNQRQQSWLTTRISQAAPQTLVVPV